jgi:hypothetical protein
VSGEDRVRAPKEEPIRRREALAQGRSTVFPVGPVGLVGRSGFPPKRPWCPARSGTPGRVWSGALAALINRVLSGARRGVVFDPEDGRVGVWRDERRIDRRPATTGSLARIISELDEHRAGRPARPVGNRAAA